MKKFIIGILCLFTFCAAQLDLDNDESERKKYGMSQAEWEKFRDLKMSVDELERLVRCGITINEYASRPWLSLGVDEQAWLAERCKGLADEDIQAFNENQNRDLSVILGFFLPGSYQWTHQQIARALPLSAVFAISIGCFFAFPQETEQPLQAIAGDPSPSGRTEIIRSRRPIFLVIAMADMIFSGILTYRETSDRHAPVPPDMQEKDTPEPAPAPSQGSFHLDYRDHHPEVRYVVTF